MDSFSENRPAEPQPRDFDVYLPWACKQLGIETNITIVKIQSLEKPNFGGAKSKKSNIKSRRDMNESKDINKSSDDFKTFDVIQSENTVIINTVYDFFGDLIQLKFDKNKKVPKQLFKLIGFFIHFHKSLTSITINTGLDNECLYELKKFVSLANITDVCLDNTALGDHYHLLLQDSNTLKHLSVSRCKIDDAAVERIAISLKHPLPASKTLLILNLTSNLITDIGAKYLAAALRINSKLVYLNLADNKITDRGAAEIFDALKDFLVTDEELMSFKHRKMRFLKEKNCLVNQIALELKCEAFERKLSKKKPVKPTNAIASKKSSKRGNEKDIIGTARDMNNVREADALWIEKATVAATEKMGKFIEPYSAENVYVKDGKVYCYGNNNLAYINMSYNNISYITVKKIHSVLLTQQRQNRTPKGLINMSLDGNFIPSRCRELEQIDSILFSNMQTIGKKNTLINQKKSVKELISMNAMPTK